MKLFIAAISVQGALALLHTSVYTQATLWPDYGDFSICNTVFDSNLGGKGPDFGKPEELRYFQVMNDIDLVVKTIGPYNVHNIHRNGVTDTLHGCFGQINLASGGSGTTDVKLQFNFYKTNTNESVTMGAFHFSWFDIDEGSKGKAKETVVFHGVEEVHVDEDSLLIYTPSDSAHDANYSHAFTSTEQGFIHDNPTDPLSLTAFQRKISVTALYRNTGMWTADLSVERGNGGRNFVFAGRSALVSPPPTPSPTDSPTPSPTDPPTPSPTDSPTPSPTPSPTDSLTPSPTPSPPGSATATGDPHLTNMRGYSFDLWQLGQVQFFRIPSDASRSNAEFMLDAVIENSTSDWRLKACLSPYVIEAAISGPSIPESIFVNVGLPGQITVRINGSTTYFDSTKKQVGEIYGRPLFMRKTTPVPHPRMPLNTNQAAEFLVGDAVIQFSAGKAHLNIFADGMLTFKERVGGLLGEDDFAAAATPPKQCAGKGGSKQLMNENRFRGTRKRRAVFLVNERPALRNTAMYSA